MSTYTKYTTYNPTPSGFDYVANITLLTSALDTDFTLESNRIDTLVTKTSGINALGDTFTGDLVGNASTATTLQNARTINGTSFNGSANININTYIGATNPSADTSMYPVLVGANTVTNQVANTDASFVYNSITKALTATTFIGNLTGSVTGTASNAALLDNLDSTQFLRSDIADIKTSGALTFNDGVPAYFGTGGSADLTIFHNGVSATIGNDTGVLNISCTTGIFLQYGGATKLNTTNTGINVTGSVVTTNGTLVPRTRGSGQFPSTGTSLFWDVPAWATKVTLLFEAVDTTASTVIEVRGANGTTEDTTGYQSQTTQITYAGTASGALSSSGFRVVSSSNGFDISGRVSLEICNGGVWVCDSNLAEYSVSGARWHNVGQNYFTGGFNRVYVRCTSGQFNGGYMRAIFE